MEEMKLSAVKVALEVSQALPCISHSLDLIDGLGSVAG